MKSEYDIALRPASSADAPIVHAMLLELALAMGAPKKISSTAQDIAAVLSGDAPAIHALIAEQQSKPVGLAIFFLNFSTWRGALGVYVQDIYVAANVRGTGLGKKLLQAAAAWGQTQGADHLRLSADPDNASACAFYTSVGLTLLDDECVYTAVGESFANLGRGS